MGLDDDLRDVEEHVAEARRIVHRQKGLIVRVQAAGVSTWDAQKLLWLLESNLWRLEEHRTAFGTDKKHSDAGHCRNTSRRAQCQSDAGCLSGAGA